MAEQQTKKKKSIAQKWKGVIDERGLKQTWVANRAGISPEHLSNILADRVLLTDDTKDKINEALGTNF